MEFLTAGASLLGGLVNNLFAGSRQNEAQDFAREQAATAQANFRTNRQTAYQDTMGDMRAAGLNPILAYQRGATAGTMSPTPSPTITPTSDFGIGQAASSAVAAMKIKAEIDNMRETNQLLRRQQDLTAAKTETEKNQPDNVKADTEQKQNMAKRIQFEIVPQLQKAQEAGHLLDFMVANPTLTHAIIAGSWMGGKAGEAAEPFIDMAKRALSGTAKNSAPSPARPGGAGPNSGWKSKNMSEQDMLVDPAPKKPGGWFTDRWDAMRTRDPWGPRGNIWNDR